MILHAPGYNLSSHRQPVRAATGRGLALPLPASPGKRPGQELTCLSRLCEGVDALSVRGEMARPIGELCTDSRRVSGDSLFFALPGARSASGGAAREIDGSFYIEEAIDRGAVAVVTERAGLHHPRATFIQVEDVRAVMALISRRFFRFSPGDPLLIGVAGSHGKTCVAHLLKHLLSPRDEAVGLFSSVHYDLGSRVVPSYRSTPESIDLYGMLAQVRESGCRRAVLEISSRGIEQKRVAGLPLDVAVFLNAGRERVGADRAAKDCFMAAAGLFSGASGPLPRVAAVNLDDSRGQRLIQRIPQPVRVVTFGRSLYADIRATDIVEGDGGAFLRIVWPEGSAKVRTRQIGSFAVSNLLAAIAAAYGAGLDLNLVLARTFSFRGAPGRMERVDEGQPFGLIVDSAHTPEAARHALRAARELCDGRLLVVFGCRGEQERTRRRFLVEAIQEEADFCWATADNPRNEPLGGVFSDMRQGVIDPERLVFVDDRRRAIALALDTARRGDVVALLGKGHEVFQYLGDAARPFDDRLVARELLALREVALSGS